MKGGSSFALLFALGACGGKAASYEYWSNLHVAPASGGAGAMSGAGTSSVSGASPGGAGSAGSGADGGSGANGGSGAGGDTSGGASGSASGGVAGQISDGGSTGTAGEGGGAGQSGGGSSGASGSSGAGGAKACASVTECPRPTNPCLAARCSAGSCVTESVPAGSLYALDAPADCHATIACDGSGHPTLTVDQSNAPIPSNQCLVGTCNDSGVAGSEPLPSGTPCHADAGGGKCDGQGSCVACLATADCPLGQTCNANGACIGQACSDLHCGAACPACIAQKCAKNADCASRVCDLATLRCVANPQCEDGRQDGNETAVDCGGGICPGCGLAQGCLSNTDCGSFACDAASHTCIADACTDHRMDGDESDVDCGGTNLSCNRCGAAQKCNSNFDCAGGHICPQSSKVCL